MAKLNDFIRALELSVEKENMAPSTEQIEKAMHTAATPVIRNGHIWYRFADGEMLSLNSCVRYAQMLAA